MGHQHERTIEKTPTTVGNNYACSTDSISHVPTGHDSKDWTTKFSAGKVCFVRSRIETNGDVPDSSREEGAANCKCTCRSTRAQSSLGHGTIAVGCIHTPQLGWQYQ